MTDLGELIRLRDMANQAIKEARDVTAKQEEIKLQTRCTCPSPRLPVVWNYPKMKRSIVTNKCAHCGFPITPRLEGRHDHS